jgi:iron-sulfur cluster assembly protein
MSETPIKLTERAVTEVKRVMEEQGFKTDEYVLEAGVIGGGCSGFQYKLGFKEKKDVNDKVEDLIAFEGLEVALNKRAMLYMQGTTIDFHEGLDKRGFTFDNPQSTGRCGCGSSFTV